MTLKLSQEQMKEISKKVALAVSKLDDYQYEKMRRVFSNVKSDRMLADAITDYSHLGKDFLNLLQYKIDGYDYREIRDIIKLGMATSHTYK